MSEAPREQLRLDSRPELRRPVLVACFKGWNDGGQGASSAGAFLARASDCGCPRGRSEVE